MPTFADTTFANACDLAARCARRTMNTWHVLDDRGHYLIADDADAAAWGDRIVWSVEPEMAFSAVELDGPLCDALTTAIVTTIVRDGLTTPALCCANCHAPHHTWQCPEIGDLLFAERLEQALVVEQLMVA